MQTAQIPKEMHSRMGLRNRQVDTLIPSISDAEIRGIASHLDVQFDEARKEILRSKSSFDVQACPGSGKTTLLVAKLALLAERWPHARRGICVLSHTNVARREIEERLTGTRAGQLLLAYPHFIGTIHGFVNEFLALPIVRSDGREVRLIDDGACFEWMKLRLTSWPRRAKLGNLPFRERTLDALIWAMVCAGDTASLHVPPTVTEDQWAALVEAKQAAMARGFWYYMDMFAWAENLLAQYPHAVAFARQRFPVVFIDEMQDTSEEQNRLLARVFPVDSCAMRQRFGDSNQAIYESRGVAATTDPFLGGCVRSIPNSKRFGGAIAQHAAPVAPAPPEPELVGDGPNAERFRPDLSSSPMPHTIFLFTTESIGDVLPAFGSLLLRVFPDSVLRSREFLARAVGRVGQSQAEDDKIPRHLIDYWAGYQAQAAKLEARPGKLADYVHLAQRRRAGQCDCAEAVKVAARGLSELVHILTPTAELSNFRPMKSLRDAVSEDRAARRVMESLIWRWCVKAEAISEELWARHVARARRALFPIMGDAWTADADGFCQWSEEFAGDGSNPGSTDGHPPNVFCFIEGSRSVDIDVGTIHSAKGQTHTATLVVETFFKKHDLADLLAWLLGDKYGAGNREGVERLARMRLIYTAMTRPSHLLCLAMRKEAVAEGEAALETIDKLKARGWVVQEL